LEGRWAQLTIDAHIAKAIDYSRPVKPFIERAVLAQMDLIRDLRYSALYPALSEDSEGELLRTKEWVEHLKQRLKPWMEKQTVQNSTEATLLDEIAFLEEHRKEYE